MQFGRQDEGTRQRRRLPPPPNYFSRSVQLRLMMLASAFMLVVVLMFEAKKPENWHWMWAGEAATDAGYVLAEQIETRLTPREPAPDDPPGLVYATKPEPSVAGDLPVEEPHADLLMPMRIDAWRHVLKGLTAEQQHLFMRVLRGEREQSPATSEHSELATLVNQLDAAWSSHLAESHEGVLLTARDLPAERTEQLLASQDELELEWNERMRPALKALADGTPSADDSAAIALLQRTLDELALGEIKDDMVLRPQEHAAWFRLIDKLLAADETLLEDESLGEMGFVQLFRQPKEYRGQLVTVRGTARRAHYLTAPPNESRVDGYYMFVLEPADGASSPIIVYSLEVPTDFPEIGIEHTSLQEDMSFTGYFFKRWAYPAADGIRTAPLLLARRPQWNPAATAARTDAMSPPWIGFAALAVIAGGLLFVRWVYVSSGAPRPTMRTAQTEATSEQLRALSREEVAPSIRESLRRMSDSDTKQ